MDCKRAGSWLLAVFVWLSATALAQNPEVDYLKKLLDSLRRARAEALASGDEQEASRLLGKMEETEYILAHLLTEMVGPEAAEPTPPGPAPTPTSPSPGAGPSVQPTAGSFVLEEPWSGSTRELLGALQLHGLLIVEPLPLLELGEVRVSAGRYESLTLARAALTVAGVDFHILEPGPILILGRAAPDP